MRFMTSIRPSRCEQITVRGLHYNVRHWGADDAPTVFMLHGWMDASPTFQFVIDAMAHEWHVIAPDWRGFGASEWLGRPYWFPDYYADLDAIVDHYQADAPVTLIGHSMGASISAMYAAARPARVARVAMLDFLGLKAMGADETPERIAAWLDECRKPQTMRRYNDHAALARRLMLSNPRLTEERAAFLAQHVSRRTADGGVEMACDAWHRAASPARYQIDEAMACWRRVEAPVLMLIAEHGFVMERFGEEPEELQRRLNCFRNVQTQTIADAGHNLHHDQPAAVAAALDAFLE